MFLSHSGNAAYPPPLDTRGVSLAPHDAEIFLSISRAQILMRDGRHVDAASILSQCGRRQYMATADAARIVQMLSECAQFCAGNSRDTVLLGIQMCHDAQTLAESTGLPPQQLLPVLLVLGHLLLSLGSFAEAIDMFQRVCYFDKCFGSYEPSHALMLASALRQSGQHRDAMSNASAAVQRLRIEHAKILARDHASQGIVYPELASTHGTLVRGLHEIASIFSSKGDAVSASVWTQQAHALNETHARTLQLRSAGGRLSHRAAQQGVLPPSLVTRSNSANTAQDIDSDCSLQSLDDDIDAPSAPHASHAATSSPTLSRVVIPTAPMLSFVRRLGVGRVVLPSIDALLSARGDEHREQQQQQQHEQQGHLLQDRRIQNDHRDQTQPSFQSLAREHFDVSHGQQQEMQSHLLHDQQGIFYSHAHREPEASAHPLPSRQSLRVISSSPVGASRDFNSHPVDAAVEVERARPQALSHVPRPFTAAAAVTSAAKQSDEFPDGRFEFVGASIADGRRKHLARPSTAHPSRPGRRQHAAVAHLFDAKQAVAGSKRNEGSASGGEYSQVIGSPQDSANGSNRIDTVDGGGSNCDDDMSVPIDSRNVSGSDDDAGSYLDGEDRDDEEDDSGNDRDDGSDLCTRDEELSVPGDGEGQSQSDYDSCSMTPSCDSSVAKGRPVVPQLDLRAISSLDRPFESDGEAPPPDDDAQTSISYRSSRYENEQQQQQQQYSQDEQDHNQHRLYQHQQHHNHQPEPESLSVFKQGLRDLAVRHRKADGGASQRMMSSRMYAAAVAVQCAWRARMARFAALNILNKLLQKQHQQDENEEEEEQQQEEAGDRSQDSTDHPGPRYSDGFFNRHAFDSNDQETLSLISDAPSPPSIMAPGAKMPEYGVGSLREALQPLLHEELQRMHATIASALEQQEAAISSILASSLPPRHPLPNRVAASPLYPSPPHPHLRVSALVGEAHEGFSPFGPDHDGEERRYEGDHIASAAPTPAILSHSPGTYHRSSRNAQVGLSSGSSPQPLFSSDVGSLVVTSHGGRGERREKESSFMEHNRQLLSQALQTVAHLGSASHQPLNSEVCVPLPPLPGDGHSCSVLIQTETPSAFLVLQPSPSSPIARGITVACQCNLLSVDECTTLISSIWRGHVTRVLFAPVFMAYRRTLYIRRIQKVLRGHLGRRLFMHVHSVSFRRKLKMAARLLCARCAGVLLISRMRARSTRQHGRVLASFCRVAVATTTYRHLRAHRVTRNIASYQAACAVALQAVFRSFIARRSTKSIFCTPPNSLSIIDTAHARRCTAASVLIKHCLYALDRRDAAAHLAAAAQARTEHAIVVLRCGVKYFLRKFRVRVFPRKRFAASLIQLAWLCCRARAAHRQAARTRICLILGRNIPVICSAGWKEWSVHRVHWLKSKQALFTRLHSSQITIALAWKCSCSFRLFDQRLRSHRINFAASVIALNWQRHVALVRFKSQSVRMQAFLETRKRLEENGPIKHALLQEQRAIDSRKALVSATEMQSPKPQPVRRLAAAKIYTACRLLLSKNALRCAREAKLAASACAIQRAARRHWQRTKLDAASAHVLEAMARKRARNAVVRICSCARGFLVRRMVLHSLAWKCRPVLWPVLKHLVAAIRAACIFRSSLFNPAFRYGQASVLALSLQCACRRRDSIRLFAAARFLRLIQPVAPIFQRIILCKSHQARAREMISEFLEQDAQALFIDGKATLLQCAWKCRGARKDMRSERLTTEMLREHERQTDACALVISCLRRIPLREVWCRTVGGVTLVYFQNRNAVRRRYSEALLRHWEKLKEKERKAAERLEKRSRIWTVVSAAARRALCSSAYAQTLSSVFAHERYQQTCRIMLGFKVLACVHRRAHRHSLVAHSRLISFALSALRRRAYIRAINLMKAQGAPDGATMHAPTPPWLEVSRAERLRTINHLKRSEKWSEFFSKLAAQQPSPAAFAKNGAETESGVEASSFHAPKQESVAQSPAVVAAATPIKGVGLSSTQSSQDNRSSQHSGLKPLAPNALPASLKSVVRSPDLVRPTAMTSSLPGRGLGQEQQQQQQLVSQSNAKRQQEQPPIPPPNFQAPAASAPFSPSPLLSSSSEPLLPAFPTDDGGYEPDEGLNVTKKPRKKSKERLSAGDSQAASKSSESGPTAGDASKPPRFRKSDPQQQQQQQSETAQAAGSKPPLHRTGSNASTGSVGSAASQEFASLSAQTTLLAFKAARFGYHDQLAQAFTAGVSPDIRDDKGYTLLMQSSMNGNMRCMKACLRAGSDMDATNNDGNTAAHLAFKFGHSELGEYLLSKGASDSIENKDRLVCRALARPQPLA